MKTTGEMSSDVRIGLKMSRQGGQRVLGVRASAEIQHIGSHVGRAARNWLSKGLGEAVDDGKNSLATGVGEGRRIRITVSFVHRGVWHPTTVSETKRRWVCGSKSERKPRTCAERERCDRGGQG